MNDQPVQEPPATAAPPRFQFSLLQLLLFVIAIGAYLGFAISDLLLTLGFTIAACIVCLFVSIWNRDPMRMLVSASVLVLVAVSFSIISEVSGFRGRQSNRAGDQLSLIIHALEKYRSDYPAYPPDNIPAGSGSEVLYHYLCRPSPAKLYFGSYLSNKKLPDTDGDGKQEIKTPTGHDYIYLLRTDASGEITPQVIDPGPDGLFGGTVIPGRGFVPDNTDANADGIPDDQDNLHSNKN